VSSANRTAWSNHAKRYYEENPLPLDVVDYCGQDFPTDADLQLIGNAFGLCALELGAGACNCGIALAKQGAKVTCMDFSAEQLALGRVAAQKAEVSLELLEGDMADLSALPSDSFDLTISISALMYVKDIEKVFREVARVLKSGGRFIFSTDHPVIMAVGATELWPEEGADPGYNYRGPIQWKWFSDDDFVFTTYRRPVADFVNGLVAAGFGLERMVDLYPKGEPSWDSLERELRQRYPSVLVIAARKI
jgi:SAM-dependent methyltransferase